ncbi:MAG: YidC/Oxa1 family membrane protein insertase [Actinobacteria bacterium]|nr:YidC/Oxa1 family membrane protein insertase [Actinomycetota bacterium]
MTAPLASVLSPIENALTGALEWLHTSIGLPWGVAIVVLTVLVRIAILPLVIRQIHSMQRLQLVMPELKAIQNRYKNDKARQQQEMMAFYRENKVNPAASCLPVLFQIPVFIGLFYVLRGFEEEVWRPKYPGSDLSFLNVVPDITDPITAHWSGYLLLVLYVASQLGSIISMPMTDPRQKWIFIALPFIFVFFILQFPMGLMLYWVTTNLWSVGQGLITRRLMPKPPAAPPKKSSRAEPRRPDDGGNGAKTREVPPKAGPPAQRRVRRRKKRGPQARR